jgi:hypothetical protein
MKYLTLEKIHALKYRLIIVGTILIIAILIGLFFLLKFLNIEIFKAQPYASLFSVASSTGVTYFTVMESGKVGFGTDNPQTGFEVAGPIRLTAKSPDGCAAWSEGEIAYNPDNKHFWGCNGTEWRALDN